MTIDNINERLRQAIKVIKAGDKATGQALLVDILQDDINNEMAWLWLSEVMDDIPRRRECLKNVLKINSNNELAKTGLSILEQKNACHQQAAATPAASASTVVTKQSQAVEDRNQLTAWQGVKESYEERPENSGRSRRGAAWNKGWSGTNGGGGKVATWNDEWLGDVDEYGKVTAWNGEWLGDVDEYGKVTTWDDEWSGDVDEYGKVTAWNSEWLGDIDEYGKVTAWNGEWLGDITPPNVRFGGAALLLLFLQECKSCNEWKEKEDLQECSQCSGLICADCAKTCSSCGATLCDSCVQTCSQCFGDICGNCMCMGSYGTEICYDCYS